MKGALAAAKAEVAAAKSEEQVDKAVVRAKTKGARKRKSVEEPIKVTRALLEASKSKAKKPKKRTPVASNVKDPEMANRLKLLRRPNPKKSEAELLKMIQVEGKSASASPKQKKRWFAAKS